MRYGVESLSAEMASLLPGSQAYLQTVILMSFSADATSSRNFRRYAELFDLEIRAERYKFGRRSEADRLPSCLI